MSDDIVVACLESKDVVKPLKAFHTKSAYEEWIERPANIYTDDEIKLYRMKLNTGL